MPQEKVSNTRHAVVSMKDFSPRWVGFLPLGCWSVGALVGNYNNSSLNNSGSNGYSVRCVLEK